MSGSFGLIVVKFNLLLIAYSPYVSTRKYIVIQYSLKYNLPELYGNVFSV